MQVPLHKTKLRNRPFFIGIVLLITVSVSAAAQPENIYGLPPEAVEHLPGVAKLFEVGYASQPPRIVGGAFVPGEIVARFPLGMGDEEIKLVAWLSGALGTERLSPIGLFLLHAPPSVPATERVLEKLWETRTAVSISAGRLYVNPGEIPGNGIDDDGNGYVDDVSGWSGIEDSNNIFDTKNNGHGTYVASILLANTNNDHQIAGFDHSARLLPLKSNETGAVADADFEACLDYLIVNPGIANVVNMSVAGLNETPGLEAGLSAVALSSILIGGSGNDGPNHANVDYPESHPDVITVGGTDRNDQLAYFSATGDTLDFSAPAVDIYTASYAQPLLRTEAHSDSGTSFSAPMVSGIAALGFSIRPSMTKSDLVYALKESAVDLGAPGWDPEFGWGRVNAHRTLVVLQSMIFIDDFETGGVSAWSSSIP